MIIEAVRVIIEAVRVITEAVRLFVEAVRVLVEAVRVFLFTNIYSTFIRIHWYQSCESRRQTFSSISGPRFS